MKAITVGLVKQPHSSRVYHVEKLAVWINVPKIVPSMTDNEVRFAQGKSAVLEHIQIESQNVPEGAFDSEWVNALIEQFTAPTFNWASPMNEIMFCAGVKDALEIVVRYYNEELT